MASVAACLIVRDSADDIIRCLDSVLGFAERIVVIDTGSEDNTPELITEWAEGHDVPLDLEFSEWVNFRHNRSELMELARGKADWLLLLDDDMVLHAPEIDWDSLTADAYCGTVGDGVDYKLPLLIRGDKEWRYEGVAHCYLACEPPLYQQEVLPGLWVEDHSVVNPAKLESDLKALTAEHAANPLDARTVFYLAQTYRDLDRPREAIQFYLMRAQMDGWPEETYIARLFAGTLLSQHVGFEQGSRLLLSAWEMRPTRAEALRALAGIAEAVADKIPFPTDDLLGINPYAYKTKGITADKVSAVIVTRGNVDLQPILDVIPFDDVVVWDNSVREDFRIFGRYKAAELARNDVIFSIDDDVVFTEFDRLLAEYEPGKILANMDPGWAAIYGRQTALIGAGALWDRQLAVKAFDRYLDEHPPVTPEDKEFFELEADFIFGSMTPFKIVDLGYEVRPFADDPDRLYQQPGQTERKYEAIRRAKALR